MVIVPSNSNDAGLQIISEQKAKGRPIPPLDVQIAAVAPQQALTVLTADKHFDYIDNLIVESWLA